jgi:hypothetical protein
LTNLEKGDLCRVGRLLGIPTSSKKVKFGK